MTPEARPDGPGSIEGAIMPAIERVIDARPMVAQLLLNAVAADLPIGVAAALQARIHLAENAPECACAVLSDALGAMNEPDPSLLALRARAWLARGAPEHALRDAASAAQVVPPHSQAVGLYVTLLMERHAFADAAAAVRRAMKGGAVDAPVHAALALALLCLDDVDAADHAIRAGLAAFPMQADLQHLAERCLGRRVPPSTASGPIAP